MVNVGERSIVVVVVVVVALACSHSLRRVHSEQTHAKPLGNLSLYYMTLIQTIRLRKRAKEIED